MISSAPTMLLFIEPIEPPTAAPLIDAVTRRMAGAMKHRKPTKEVWRGFHMCTGCTAHSDNRDYLVPTVDGARLKTNSLAIHYLAHHRAEVLQAELDKVMRLVGDEIEPTAGQLRGDRRWPQE
jgi:hypothetical protein